MATYYVRKTGSDSNDGLSPANAWLTIDKAATDVIANDTVYVGAGVYRETVTPNTSGSSGNIISYIADVDGSQTGDPGLVVITAWDDDGDTEVSLRQPLSIAIREYLTFKDFVFITGSGDNYHGSGSSNRTFESITFDGCVFDNAHADSYAAYFNYYGGLPTTAGLTFRNCFFNGGLGIISSAAGASTRDLKATIENCHFTANSGLVPRMAAISVTFNTSSSFGSGGIAIRNCTFDSAYYGVYVEDPTGTPDAGVTVSVRDSLFKKCRYGLYKETENDGLLESLGGNIYDSVYTNHTNVDFHGSDGFTGERGAPVMWGGNHDLPLYRNWGWSPFAPFEIISTGGYTPKGYGSSSSPTSTDVYGNPRPMSGRSGHRWGKYHFDASDAGPTDTDTVWTNDANAFDGDISTVASTTTAGSSASNNLSGEGTNAPASGGTILEVQSRMRSGTITSGNISYLTYEDGDLGGTSLSSGNRTTSNSYSSWTTLNAPTGGWSWAAVQALECLVYSSAAAANEIAAVEIRVRSVPQSDGDVGFTEARSRPTQETTTVRTGSNSFSFDGAGYQDFFVPVSTELVTVDVYGRYDSNYTGSLPILEVFNIPGVADQSDVMVAAANTWEALQCTFTPTAQGVVRVRLRSQDTSVDGKAFFDDLAVS